MPSSLAYFGPEQVENPVIAKNLKGTVLGPITSGVGDPKPQGGEDDARQRPLLVQNTVEVGPMDAGLL